MTEEKPPAYNPADSAYPPAGPPPPAYDAAQGYPTQQQPGAQPGYPPQQPGYPPQQAGYPQQPAGAGYPMQPGYPQQAGYPAGQPGYPPGPQATVVVGQPTTTTIVTTSVGMQVSDRPVNTTCPNCNNQVTSVVQKTVGGMVWLIAAILCIVGLWPCCLIPFCITDLYDCDHTCPVCRYHLGSFRRL